MIVIEKEVFIWQWTKTNWSRLRVAPTNGMEGRNINALTNETTDPLTYLFILPTEMKSCSRKYKTNTQRH